MNSRVYVKGFFQAEDLSVNISFDLDLITPDGKTIKAIFKGSENKKLTEKISDLPLESQFELDSTFTAGKYKVIFNIKDQLGNQSTKIEKEFELGEE